MRQVGLVAVMVMVAGLFSIRSVQAIEIVNRSKETVYVSLHTLTLSDYSPNPNLPDYHYDWDSEGWLTIKPGDTLKRQDSSGDASLTWVRLTYNSPKGELIKPARPNAGPARLPVHSNRFTFRRVGADKDDTWKIFNIEGHKKPPVAITAKEAVEKYGCWVAEGFYGFKRNAKLTVEAPAPAAVKPSNKGGETVFVPKKSISVTITNETGHNATFVLKSGAGPGTATGLTNGQTKTHSLAVEVGTTPVVIITQPGGGTKSFTLQDKGNYAFRMDGGKILNYVK